MSLADRIKKCSATFTPAEHRIAQVLFSSNMLAGLETIAKLGEKARASGPTVLRFSAKLGFQNYPEMQDFLREDIKDRLLSPLDLLDLPTPGETRRSLKADAARIFGHGVARTLRRIDDGTFDKIVKLLSDSTRPAHFIGGRFTQHLAEVLWGHIHLWRPRAHILRSGIVDRRELLLDVGRRDVVVAFDIRRYQDDVIGVAELAHAKRATVVLITDPLLSPISYRADHVITCDLDMLAGQDSLVPCMAVVELIVAAVGRNIDELSRKRFLSIERLRQSGTTGGIGGPDN